MAYGRIAICFLLAVMGDLTYGQTKICGLDNYDVGSLVKWVIDLCMFVYRKQYHFVSILEC